MRYFSTSETAKLAGVSYECFEEWLFRGFIKADHTKSVGAKDRIFKYWTEEGILKIRKFKDLVNLGLSRSLASKIVYGAMDQLKSEYFTIVLSTGQTALAHSGPGRRDRDVGESIADKILYAVAHHPEGLVELSVFEAGRAASVTLSPPKAAQLVEMLTSDRGQLSKQSSAVIHVLDACDSIDNGGQPTPTLRASAADTPLYDK